MVLGGLLQGGGVGHVVLRQQLDDLLHGVALGDGDGNGGRHAAGGLHGLDETVEVHVGVQLIHAGLNIAAGVEHGAGDHEQQLGVDEPRLLQLGGHRPHGVAAFHLDGGGQGGLIQGAHIVDGQPADTGQQERGHDDPRQIAQPPQAALFLWLRPLAGARLLTDLLGIPFGRIGVLIIGHMIGSFLYFFRRAHPDKIRRSHLRHRIAHTRNK